RERPSTAVLRRGDVSRELRPFVRSDRQGRRLAAAGAGLSLCPRPALRLHAGATRLADREPAWFRLALHFVLSTIAAGTADASALRQPRGDAEPVGAKQLSRALVAAVWPARHPLFPDARRRDLSLELLSPAAGDAAGRWVAVGRGRRSEDISAGDAG